MCLKHMHPIHVQNTRIRVEPLAIVLIKPIYDKQDLGAPFGHLRTAFVIFLTSATTFFRWCEAKATTTVIDLRRSESGPAGWARRRVCHMRRHS